MEEVEAECKAKKQLNLAVNIKDSTRSDQTRRDQIIIIEDCHKETKHGLVSLTMANVCELYWIERLRQ